MRILVLESSGNPESSSNVLARDFVKGAKDAGNYVDVYNVFSAGINPCRGCGACGMAGPCVQDDDFERGLKPRIRASDMLVFVMPVYFYNWPAPIVATVDRFYSFVTELGRAGKKTALIATSWDSDDMGFENVVGYYKRLCEYMHFRDMGVIAAKGCGSKDMVAVSSYPQKAYELGKSLS